MPWLVFRPGHSSSVLMSESTTVAEAISSIGVKKGELFLRMHLIFSEGVKVRGDTDR